MNHDFLKDKRFAGIEPFSSKVWLSSPTNHKDGMRYVKEAYDTNWLSTVGENINQVEKELASLIGAGHAVALSSGTAALHLAVRLAGEKLYGRPKIGHGTLEGRKVFCSDMTFDATVNPVAYEGGEAVFIDSEYDTWNMDPDALERAFQIYPETRLIVVAHLYGTPGNLERIRKIADKHGALLVEDAAESLGASYQGVQTGRFGDYGIISFNGNKIITGSSGGMLLCESAKDAGKVRKWSTQSREEAPWYQHEELGYNYRMSNIIAGLIRGQLGHLEEHIRSKKKIYERYQVGFKNLPVDMNPIGENCEPNYWLSCLTIREEAMCETVQGEREALYVSAAGKSCPTEILNALQAFHAEGRPIWKPMHLQPIYRMNPFVSCGPEEGREVGGDIFKRGLCLPSDNKMTEEEQDKVMEIVCRCFE